MRTNKYRSQIIWSVFFLFIFPSIAFSQGTLEGQVIDSETDEPLPGVGILINELERGTSTDTEGNFTLTDLEAGSYQVEVSFVGYQAETHDVTISDNEITTLNISLESGLLQLDELVVTGPAAGTERRALGNTVASIRTDDALELGQVGDMQSMINARASGVVIQPGTGMVGSGSRIRVRGVSSFSLSNEPIIYVDGVRVDNNNDSGPAVQGFGSSVINRLNDFNPEDIENIEILKGPAAATMYGTEASNGVIQIHTRQGARDTDPEFSFTTRQGVNYFANKEDRMYTNYWTDPDGNVHSLNLVESERERGTPIFEPGHLQRYNLSVGGGTQNLQYYLSGNYQNEEGVEPTNHLEQYGGRLNLHLDATDRLDVTGNLGVTAGTTFLAREGGTGGVTWGAYFSTPAHLEENLPEDAPPHRGYRSFTSDAYYEYDDFQDITRVTGSLQLNFNAADWNRHRISYGLDFLSEDNQTVLENSEVYRQFSPTSEGSKSVNIRDINTQTLDYNTDFMFDLTTSIHSRTTAGVQFYRSLTKNASAFGTDFVVPGLRAVTAAVDDEASESYLEVRNLGVFAQQQFSYFDRLYFTAGMRADDNSAFGEDFDLVLYPSLSSSWVVSDEPFFEVDPVSSLRFRAAYGQTGQQPGFFDALRTFSGIRGQGGVGAVTTGSIGNPDLGPERSTEFEAGFDLGLFDEMYSLDFSYYRTSTRDAILARDVAPSSGFAGDIFINVGELQNQGFETSLNANPIREENYSLDLSFSISRNTNEVIDTGIEGQDRLVHNAAFGVEHREGQPLGGIYMPRIVEVTGNPLDADGNLRPGNELHDIAICEAEDGGNIPCWDNDGNFQAPDQFIGRSLPEWEGAVSATFRFLGNFRFYAMVDYKLGHHKWDYNEEVRGLFNVLPAQHIPEDFNDQENLVARNFRTFSDNVQPADFARLREVSLSYNLPVSFVNNLGLNSASITITGRNLLTFTGYPGMEPEAMFMGGGRGGFGAIEQNALPQLQQVVGALNIKF